jgi:hypothetical protein
MIERGTVRINIQRGATVVEFKSFLDDLEHAYLAIHALPSRREWRNLRHRFEFPPEFFPIDAFGNRYADAERYRSEDTYPPDQLEIAKIKIQSPGWIELVASFNPLQQIREYLKDRHERKKDKEWRWDSEKMRAMAELDLLKIQARHGEAVALREYYGLLKDMGVNQHEIDKVIWERVGTPLSRLARHQDSGLLGSQNDNIDGCRD